VTVKTSITNKCCS